MGERIAIGLEAEFLHSPLRDEYSDPVDEVCIKNAHRYEARGRMLPERSAMYESLARDFSEEFSLFTDFLAGKYEFREILHSKGSRCELYYLQWPDAFEQAVIALGTYPGELLPGDEIWINNTRELIKKYYPVVRENLKKIYPHEFDEGEKNEKESDR